MNPVSHLPLIYLSVANGSRLDHVRKTRQPDSSPGQRQPQYCLPCTRLGVRGKCQSIRERLVCLFRIDLSLITIHNAPLT